MRFRRQSFLVLVVMVSAAACTERSEPASQYGPPSLEHEGISTSRLTGRVLNGGDFLGVPSDVVLVGEDIVLLDGAADSVGHVLRAGDGMLVRSFGRRGEGPGEYKAAWSLAPGVGPDEVWVYDLALRRFTRVSLDEAKLRGSGRLDTQMIALQPGATVTGPQWVGEQRLVSLGFFDDGRIAEFGADGRLRRTVGILPPGEERIPPHVRQHAYTGSLVTNVARGLVAVGTRHADQVEIYRTDGHLLRSARGPFGFAPRFDVAQRPGGPALGTDDGLRFGYVDLAASEARIYALFSGRTREGHGGNAVFGRYVHVYDWDGKLVDVLELDSDLLAISVDPHDQVLYGVRHDPTPAVLAYPLT